MVLEGICEENPLYRVDEEGKSGLTSITGKATIRQIAGCEPSAVRWTVAGPRRGQPGKSLRTDGGNT